MRVLDGATELVRHRRCWDSHTQIEIEAHVQRLVDACLLYTSQALRGALNSERFCDTAPAAVHATLLGEGTYLGSVRTMYRLLAASGCRERRNQLTHPAYTKPELLAIAPNQVWSWDCLLYTSVAVAGGVGSKKRAPATRASKAARYCGSRSGSRLASEKV